MSRAKFDKIMAKAIVDWRELSKKEVAEGRQLEEMDCPALPKALVTCDDAWTYLGYKYCKMSNAVQTDKALWGSLKAAGKIAMACGPNQAISTFKTIGGCFVGIGQLFYNPKKAAQTFTSVGDDARAIVDPSVQVSGIANEISIASASGVLSCTASIVTAYLAFRYQESAKWGNCGAGSVGGLRWLKFAVSHTAGCEPSAPHTCAMPPLASNPFLQTIIADGGCPNGLIEYIKAAKTHLYWSELVQKTVQIALKHPGLIVIIGTKIYTEAARSTYDIIADGWFKFAIPSKEMSKYVGAHFKLENPCSSSDYNWNCPKITPTPAPAVAPADDQFSGFA